MSERGNATAVESWPRWKQETTAITDLNGDGQNSLGCRLENPLGEYVISTPDGTHTPTTAIEPRGERRVIPVLQRTSNRRRKDGNFADRFKGRNSLSKNKSWPTNFPVFRTFGSGWISSFPQLGLALYWILLFEQWNIFAWDTYLQQSSGSRCKLLEMPKSEWSASILKKKIKLIKYHGFQALYIMISRRFSTTNQGTPGISSVGLTFIWKTSFSTPGLLDSRI